MSENDSAILVVSFGTSHEDTRKKTLDVIEERVRDTFPQYRVYRAWTSGMIRSKIEKRDGIVIPDVKGAMEQMAADDVRSLIVQPTHVLNGIENREMLRQVQENARLFSGIAVGDPLLTSREDHTYLMQAVADALKPAKDEALVLMGHGSSHFSNDAYAALDYAFKDSGYPNIFMGTVEGYPGFDSLLKQVKTYAPKRLILAPFMIVAGEHAVRDLSGTSPDSWKSRFEREGYEVSCVLKGLGEYESVRDLLTAHIKDAIKRLENGGDPWV